MSEIKILESTPIIEKVREAYKVLRKNLKNKGVDVSSIRMIKRKRIWGIKIGITDKDKANQIPAFQDSVPIHKIEIITPSEIIKASDTSPVNTTSCKFKDANFKIEKVKWQWANSVKSKTIYRDDEFIRAKTKEEALGAIGYCLTHPKGMTYTITVFRDGEYFTYYRHSMPCWGGFVKYRDSHGERYFMNPYFPRDIYVAFPEGDIIYIGCCRQKPKTESEYNKFLLSQESPWVSAFGTRESIIFEDKYFILTNMNTDPTVFYHMLRVGGFGYGGIYGAYGNTKKNWNPKAEILSSKTTQCDPRRLAGQKPIRISGGTWAEGFGYTRPYNESIFKTKLPNKLKDFGKLGGYPNAPYTNTYFMETMKKKFGIDKPNNPDQKTHDALVEAWDYFKEEAKKLDE